MKLDAFCHSGDELSYESTLFLVQTPIGNLSDLSWRALNCLSSVDLILCEDTRHSRKLLSRFDIHCPTLSCHEHNEKDRIPKVLGILQEGKNLALITDAGAPAISDPGAILVQAVVEAGHNVVSIPGPSAVISALQVSGLPATPFYFHGFLPSKKSARINCIEALALRPETLVFFEAPHRILKALSDLSEVLGQRPASLSRELTKAHEETLRGTLSQIRDVLDSRESVKGEITLCVGGCPEGPQNAPPDFANPEAHIEALVNDGVDRKEALKVVAKAWDIPRRELYKKLNKD